MSKNTVVIVSLFIIARKKLKCPSTRKMHCDINNILEYYTTMRMSKPQEDENIMDLLNIMLSKGG